MECLGRYTFFVMTPSAAFREALSLASRSLQSTAPGAKKARKCQNQEPANTSESRHVKNMRKQRLCQQRRSKQPLATKRPANKSWSAVSRLRRITIKKMNDTGDRPQTGGSRAVGCAPCATHHRPHHGPHNGPPCTPWATVDDTMGHTMGRS